MIPYIIAAVVSGCILGFITEYVINCIREIRRHNEYKIGDTGYILVMNRIEECVVVARKGKDYIVEDIDVTSQFQHEKFVVKKNEFFY
mgnify:CR=1 FL=1|jgi:putative component of membrane protein insertase Oxa1/YidC/SpoIIIJ protein YidD